MDNNKSLLAADFILSMLKHTHDVYQGLGGGYEKEMEHVSQVAIDLANTVNYLETGTVPVPDVTPNYPPMINYGFVEEVDDDDW